MRALFPLLMVLLAILSTQTGSALAKQLFPVLGPLGTTLVRITMAAVMLHAVWRPWRALPKHHPWLTLWVYGVALGGMNMLFYLAIQRIPLGVAVAFEILGPLTLAFITAHRRQDIAWGLCAVLGVALLLPLKTTLAHTTALDPVGLMYAMGAGLCWALYIWFGQKAGKNLPSGITSTLGMSVAMLVALPIGLPGVVSASQQGVLSWHVVGVALGVAILSSALPYSLEMVAMKRLPTKVFSILMSLQPAMATLAGWVILHEQLSLVQWGAIGLIIIASLGNSLGMTDPTVT